jgi:chemotaxis protein CheZ
MRETVLAPVQDALLAERMATIRTRYPDTDPDMVAEVVCAVLDVMGGDARLRTEVAEIGQLIEQARSEIAALRVEDISASHIPSATDELDAIVEHTAEATNRILEVCEVLDRLAEGPESDPPDALQHATMRIYEACSFQDITGQRIAKVVTTLKLIDERLTKIVGKPVPGVAAAPPSATPGQPLLHGPQLPANAMQQGDIDALLASFD